MRLKITKHPELDFPALFSSLHSNTNRAVHLDLHWSIDLRKPLISTFLIWCSFNLSGDVDAIHTSRDLLLFFPSIFVRFINMYKPYQEKNANSAPIFLINQLDHGKQLLCIFFLCKFCKLLPGQLQCNLYKSMFQTTRATLYARATIKATVPNARVP